MEIKNMKFGNGQILEIEDMFAKKLKKDKTSKFLSEVSLEILNSLHSSIYGTCNSSIDQVIKYEFTEEDLKDKEKLAENIQNMKTTLSETLDTKIKSKLYNGFVLYTAKRKEKSFGLKMSILNDSYIEARALVEIDEIEKILSSPLYKITVKIEDSKCVLIKTNKINGDEIVIVPEMNIKEEKDNKISISLI